MPSHLVQRVHDWEADGCFSPNSVGFRKDRGFSSTRRAILIHSDNMQFLIDLAEIKHQHLIDEALKDWDFKVHSSRCIEVSGRDWGKSDIARLWQAIGRRGHVFIYDLQNGLERYWHKNSTGEPRRTRARESDLDVCTSKLISQFLDKEAGPELVD